MVTFSHTDHGTAAAQWNAHGLGDLEQLDLSRVFAQGTKLVVLAAHPDDETLGAGGLIHQAVKMGLEVTVLACTSGEASHPESATHSPAQLAVVREAELEQAMALLRAEAKASGAVHLRCLRLPDGHLPSHATEMEAALREITEGGPCVVASTYRSDGHSDHEVLGRLAAKICAELSLCLLEFPIWYWHWAAPGTEVRWRHWTQLSLDEQTVQAKRRALAAHTSQTQPLSSLPGDEVLLDSQFLEHFHGPREIFRLTWPGDKDAAAASQVFDELYAQRPDPWNYKDSHYEQRKQEIMLASLPRPRYRSVLELGCSIGMQTAALAQRSGQLLAVDASAEALAHAGEQVAGMEHVSLRQATLPGQWPHCDPGSMDLVVLSEIGYFLAADELAEVLQRCATVLEPGGELVLCHWLHPIEGWPLDGKAVHRMAGAWNWEAAVVHREQDFLLEILRKPAGRHGS